MPISRIESNSIAPSQTLTTPIIATTMGVGGATPSGSGSGITFPATQSASTDANTLDDYEEGTWTPGIVFGGLTPSAASGRYIKVGSLVTATFDVTWPSTSDTNTAGVTLPFAGLSSVYSNAFIGYTNYGSAFALENSIGTVNMLLSNFSGGGITNANFSGRRVIATAVYIASA